MDLTHDNDLESAPIQTSDTSGPFRRLCYRRGKRVNGEPVRSEPFAVTSKPGASRWESTHDLSRAHQG